MRNKILELSKSTVYVPNAEHVNAEKIVHDLAIPFIDEVWHFILQYCTLNTVILIKQFERSIHTYLSIFLLILERLFWVNNETLMKPHIYYVLKYDQIWKLAIKEQLYEMENLETHKWHKRKLNLTDPLKELWKLDKNPCQFEIFTEYSWFNVVKSILLEGKFLLWWRHCGYSE